VATKCDRADAPGGFLATSAVTGMGLEELFRELVQRFTHDLELAFNCRAKHLSGSYSSSVRPLENSLMAFAASLASHR
jgi:hypothetical protein